MNTPIYDLAFFRAFFESKNNWCTHILLDRNGNKCALGHIAHKMGYAYFHPIASPMGQALSNLFSALCSKDEIESGEAIVKDPFLLLLYGRVTGRVEAGHRALIDINNGVDVRYQQIGPKARVLAAIDDLIVMERAKQDAELDKVETRPLQAVETRPLYPIQHAESFELATL